MCRGYSATCAIADNWDEDEEDFSDDDWTGEDVVAEDVVRAVALYDFFGSAEDHLTFYSGNVIELEAA